MRKLGAWLGYGLGILAVFLGASALLRLELVSGPQAEYRGTVRVGWEDHYPYLYQQGSGSTLEETGLVHELLSRAFARKGYHVEWVGGSWADLRQQLAAGKIDALGLALRTPERERLYRFSQPYLQEYFAAFYRRGEPAPPADPQALQAFCQRRRVRLAYTRGYAYVAPLQRILDDPGLRSHSVAAVSDAEGLALVWTGEADLFFCDDLVGASQLVRRGRDDKVGRVRIHLPPEPAQVMFRPGMPQEVVESLDAGLDELRASGEEAACTRSYLYSSLLSLVTDSPFFREIGLLGGCCAAVGGILMAYRDRLNLVGAFVLAAAPAAGGGLLRDLIAGRRPVGIVASPFLLIVVAGLVLVGYALLGLADRRPAWKARVDALDLGRSPMLVFFDAAGMAAFTVIGVLVAMQTHCEPLWLWGPLLAAATNGGGGLIRDVVRATHPAPVFTTFYLQIPIFWGFLLSGFFIVYSSQQPHELPVMAAAMTATMIGVVATHWTHSRLSLRREPREVAVKQGALLDQG